MILFGFVFILYFIKLSVGNGFQDTILYAYYKNCSRVKEASFMTKELHNAIMKRSRFRNNNLKGKT